MTLRSLRALSVLCGLMLLASCSLPSGSPTASSPTLSLVTVNPNASATPTPFQPVVESFTPLPTLTFLPSLTPLPTLTPSVTPSPTPTLTATTAPPSAPETDQAPPPVPTSSRPQYTFYVLFDYFGHQLAVDETIRYTNQTGITMFDLVLAVEPNLTPNSFSLETLFLDGVTPAYTLDGHRMTITLPQALSPGGAVNLSMRYRLAIPPKSSNHPYGYLSYQANLTEAAINPPAPAQASVRLLDEVPYQSDRNGERYRVLERRYAIFPERSGQLTIPAMQLSGRLIERPSDRLWQPTVRGRRVQVESKPLTLDISPRPASFTGDHWLPARRIMLSQQIPDNGELHVGEPITRTVIVDAIGLEENMLEEPVWPDLPATRIYPDQPQGISRDDGEWVLGHKEFRYAIVPEQAGELVLPEIRLDWWDTVNHRQRTAMLPEHRVNVLPSELGPAVSLPPPTADVLNKLPGGVQAESMALSGDALYWKISTAVFALLWLLTLVFYVRRSRATENLADPHDSGSPDERELLKRFQAVCEKGDATAARKDFARWIRNYAPMELRGSMRDFGAACGDRALQVSIAELDSCGFADETNSDWKGEALWRAFKGWQARSTRSTTDDIGDKPDLYAH